MPWNGSGTFSRTYGSGGWTNDKNSGTKILASRHDTNDQDLATGIALCTTTDGQSKPACNWMPSAAATYTLGSSTYTWTSAFVSSNVQWVGGTYTTILNYGTPTANRTVSLPDYTGTLITAQQVQNQTAVALTSVSGTASNTIVGTATPAPSAYAAGQAFELVPDGTNTGATTLNVSSLGAKNVYSNGAACVGGEIVSGVPVRVYYDGTQFNLMAAGNTAGTGSSLVLLKNKPLTTAGASIDFTGYLTSTYYEYLLLVDNIQVGTLNSDLWLRFGSGGVYATANYRYVNNRTNTGGGGTTQAVSNSDSKILLGNLFNTPAVDGGHMVIKISKGSSYGGRCIWDGNYHNQGSDVLVDTRGSGWYASGVTDVQILASSGNIQADAALYGVRKS